LFFFSTTEALSIMNLLLKVRKLINIFIWRFWNVCGMWYKESDLKCGLWEAGCSVTIMHLVTQCCQLHNSWQNIHFLPVHNAPIHLTSDLLTFFYTLYSNLPSKEEDFGWWETPSLMRITTSFQQCFQKWGRQWERCIAAQGDYSEEDNIQ
jgi:hypothetical protein